MNGNSDSGYSPFRPHDILKGSDSLASPRKLSVRFSEPYKSLSPPKKATPPALARRDSISIDDLLSKHADDNRIVEPHQKDNLKPSKMTELVRRQSISIDDLLSKHGDIQSMPVDVTSSYMISSNNMNGYSNGLDQSSLTGAANTSFYNDGDYNNSSVTSSGTSYYDNNYDSNYDNTYDSNSNINNTITGMGGMSSTMPVKNFAHGTASYVNSRQATTERQKLIDHLRKLSEPDELNSDNNYNSSNSSDMGGHRAASPSALDVLMIERLAKIEAAVSLGPRMGAIGGAHGIGYDYDGLGSPSHYQNSNGAGGSLSPTEKALTDKVKDLERRLEQQNLDQMKQLQEQASEQNKKTMEYLNQIMTRIEKVQSPTASPTSFQQLQQQQEQVTIDEFPEEHAPPQQLHQHIDKKHDANDHETRRTSLLHMHAGHTPKAGLALNFVDDDKTMDNTILNEIDPLTNSSAVTNVTPTILEAGNSLGGRSRLNHVTMADASNSQASPTKVTHVTNAPIHGNGLVNFQNSNNNSGIDASPIKPVVVSGPSGPLLDGALHSPVTHGIMQNHHPMRTRGGDQRIGGASGIQLGVSLTRTPRHRRKMGNNNGNSSGSPPSSPRNNGMSPNAVSSSRATPISPPMSPGLRMVMGGFPGVHHGTGSGTTVGMGLQYGFEHGHNNMGHPGHTPGHIQGQGGVSFGSPSSSPSHNHRPGKIKNKKKHQHQKPRFQSENVADDHHGLAPPNEYPAPTEVIISDVTKERIRKREPTGFVGSGAHTTAEAAAKGIHLARLKDDDSDDEEDVVGAGAFGDHGLHVKHQQQKPTRAGTKAIVKSKHGAPKAAEKPMASPNLFETQATPSLQSQSDSNKDNIPDSDTGSSKKRVSFKSDPDVYEDTVELPKVKIQSQVEIIPTSALKGSRDSPPKSVNKSKNGSQVAETGAAVKMPKRNSQPQHQVDSDEEEDEDDYDSAEGDYFDEDEDEDEDEDDEEYSDEDDEEYSEEDEEDEEYSDEDDEEYSDEDDEEDGVEIDDTGEVDNHRHNKSASVDNNKIRSARLSASELGLRDAISAATGKRPVEAPPATKEELEKRKIKVKKEIMKMIRMKQSLKQEIKEWIVDFEAKYMRPPSTDEKAQIHDKFLGYKMLSQHLEILEEEARQLQRNNAFG